MKLKILAIASVACLASACGTTPGDRALSGGAIGAVAGAVIGNNTTGHPATGAVIGGVAGAAIGGATAPRTDGTYSADVNRRQYYDQRSGRYYFYDPQSRRYYYESGQPYP